MIRGERPLTKWLEAVDELAIAPYRSGYRGLWKCPEGVLKGVETVYRVAAGT